MLQDPMPNSHQADRQDRRRALKAIAGAGLARMGLASLGLASLGLAAEGSMQPTKANGLLGLPPLQDGDLIFHSSRSFQSAAIMHATGSPITHMGIIQTTRFGPRVIEAHVVVRDLALLHWVFHGRNAGFIIRRHPGLRPRQAQAIVQEALRLRGRPYDLMFYMDNQRPYCSEFAYVLFKRQGLELGKLQRLGDLDLSHPAVQALLDRRARRHPKCSGLQDIASCKQVLLRQPLITPRSILEDPRLVTVARRGL